MRITVKHDAGAWVAHEPTLDLMAQGPTRCDAIERLAWLIAIADGDVVPTFDEPLASGGIVAAPERMPLMGERCEPCPADVFKQERR